MGKKKNLTIFILGIRAWQSFMNCWDRMTQKERKSQKKRKRKRKREQFLFLESEPGKVSGNCWERMGEVCKCFVYRNGKNSKTSFHHFQGLDIALQL